jgi:endonuclease YncB( thermonuclease family)
MKYFLLLILLFSHQAHSENFHNVEFINNYDGDTITVNLDCDIPLFCNSMKIRVANIDTAEIRTKDNCEYKKAIEAKRFVNYRLSKAKKIDLLNCTKGKYFRLVCNINTLKGDLSSALLKLNLAYLYYGGSKKKNVDWCK